MKIVLKNISKSFGANQVLNPIEELAFESGEFTTLLGPSGCGKTTLLRMISGLESPDTGEIWFGKTCVFSAEKRLDVPPEDRNLGFVFQDFALWPHLTVFENVAFGLRARKQTDDLQNQVFQALKAVQLEEFSKRYPHQLSGGQQQRVAFARAIATKPQCILFDEPLSALDAILRDDMRIELKTLVAELGITAIFVTHDQIEAMSMSDTVVVMNKGNIEQKAAPEEIYQNPQTLFVARFVGRSNWIGSHQMFRPESLSLHPIDGAKEYKLPLSSVQFMGNTYELSLKQGSNIWHAISLDRPNSKEISVYLKDTDIFDFPNIV
ncbi:MAG: ABC transporter ATP-binding protein [Turicibacter sp.]|nr:ABC transporter ATP-binding protein [Turicibacter sp.]